MGGAIERSHEVFRRAGGFYGCDVEEALFRAPAERTPLCSDTERGDDTAEAVHEVQGDGLGKAPHQPNRRVDVVLRILRDQRPRPHSGRELYRHFSPAMNGGQRARPGVQGPSQRSRTVDSSRSSSRWTNRSVKSPTIAEASARCHAIHLLSQRSGAGSQLPYQPPMPWPASRPPQAQRQHRQPHRP